MKKNSTIVFIVFAMTAFAGASSATAQDAAAPIRRSPAPQDQAATPQPTPTPSAEPEKSPVMPTTPEPQTPLEQKANEAPRPSPTATPRVIQEKPVLAIERRPASAPAKSPESRVDERPVVLMPRAKPTFDFSDQGSGNLGATIRALENQWQNAIVQRDVSVIDELVADDFVGVSSSGRTGSKSTLLNEVRRDRNTYTSATARSMVVRAHGPRVAVVTGVAKESGTTPDGQRFTNSRRFTDTWMERGGRWQCIASHTTQLK